MSIFSFFKKKIVREKEIITVYKKPTVYINKRDKSCLANKINDYRIEYNGNTYYSGHIFQEYKTYQTVLPAAFIKFCGYSIFKENELKINSMVSDFYDKKMNFNTCLFSLIAEFPNAIESFDRLNKNQTVKKDEEEFSDNFSYLFGKLRKHEIDLQIGMGSLYDDFKALMDEIEEKNIYRNLKRNKS